MLIAYFNLQDKLYKNVLINLYNDELFFNNFKEQQEAFINQFTFTAVLQDYPPDSVTDNGFKIIDIPDNLKQNNTFNVLYRDTENNMQLSYIDNEKSTNYYNPTDFFLN